MCRAAVQGYRFFRKGRVVMGQEEVVCEKRCLRSMKLHLGEHEPMGKDQETEQHQ